jgi:hypothetical protein
MYLVGAPLLIVPFALYNIVAFLMPGVSWGAPFAHITLHSGADWPIAPGDILLTFAILLLLVELVKLTRLGVRNWVDHTLSFLLFAGMTAEFITVQTAATQTFFLLLVISFVDFFGGIVSAISARARRRELMAEQARYAAMVAQQPYSAPTPAPKAPTSPEPTPTPSPVDIRREPEPPKTEPSAA